MRMSADANRAQENDPGDRGGWLRGGAFPGRLTWAVFLITFLASLLLLTRHNDHPFHHHPDERGKARQVREKEWNYHHPMLMLVVTERSLKLLREAVDLEPTYQNIVVIGRWVVAAAGAAGVAALVTLALGQAGGLAALLAGLVLLADPMLFHAAHWMKEDPLLLAGIALTALAAAAYAARPGAGRAVALGLATGLACSGKFVGMLVLPFVLGAVLATRARSRWTLLGVVVAATTLFFLGANYRALGDIPGVVGGITREWTGVSEGHQGWRKADLELPHGAYFAYLHLALPWWTAIGILGWLVRRRAPGGWQADIVLLGFLAVYFTAISFSPKIIGRYTFPIETLALFFAAAGSGLLLARGLATPRLPLRIPLVATGAILSAALLGYKVVGLKDQGHRPGFVEYYQAYAGNPWDGIRRYAEGLPQGSIILQPEGFHLPDADHYMFEGMDIDFPHRVISNKKLRESGSLDEALALGVTHIIFTGDRPSRYLMKGVVGDAKSLDKRARIAAFYRDMHRRGRRIHVEKPTTLTKEGYEVWELGASNPAEKESS